MGCPCVSQGQGGDLLAVAVALSVLIAQGKTADQIGLLAALFNVIGDNLELLSAKVPDGEAFCPCQGEAETKNQGGCC